MNNLYIYVDESDLAAVSDVLEKEFRDFLRTWDVPQSRFINDQFPRTPDLLPEDYPNWNLGLNVAFDRLPSEKIEQLVRFLNSLSQKTGRQFAIGYYDPDHDISEDWCFVDTEYNAYDVSFLKKLYGI